MTVSGSRVVALCIPGAFCRGGAGYRVGAGFRSVRVILFIALLFQSPAALACDCAWQSSFVAARAVTVSPTRLRDITPSMSIARIVAVLGPAARDVGSGVHVLQWDTLDGRVYSISTVGACSKPVSMGFLAARADSAVRPLK